MVDGAILVTGSTEILFAEYSVAAPSAPVVVSVEDNGVHELQSGSLDSQPADA